MMMMIHFSQGSFEKSQLRCIGENLSSIFACVSTFANYICLLLLSLLLLFVYHWPLVTASKLTGVCSEPSKDPVLTFALEFNKEIT